MEHEAALAVAAKAAEAQWKVHLAVARAMQSAVVTATLMAVVPATLMEPETVR